MFLLHTMTGVSMWCWMVASLQRYWAVYHPFSNFIRSRRLAPRAILGIFVVSTVINGWLLIVVDADETRYFSLSKKQMFMFKNITVFQSIKYYACAVLRITGKKSYPP
jgi:hypothetical protein